jgi:hypothetical protein
MSIRFNNFNQESNEAVHLGGGATINTLANALSCQACIQVVYATDKPIRPEYQNTMWNMFLSSHKTFYRTMTCASIFKKHDPTVASHIAFNYKKIYFDIDFGWFSRSLGI